jgi:hypothetical protein
MKTLRGVVVLVLTGVALVGLSSACKRVSGPERSMMATLAGTWTWKEEKAVEPTVIVLELTAKGRYKESTYREVRNQRKLLYVKRLTMEMLYEPEDKPTIGRIKKEGYEPAMDEGGYRLKLGDKAEKITFQSSKLTSVQKTDRSGIREEALTIESPNRIVIGGRAYTR